MSTRSSMGYIPASRTHRRTHAFVALLIAAALALLVVEVLYAPSDAYASIYAVPQPTEAEDQGDSENDAWTYEWADDLDSDQDDSAKSEKIKDEANPLAAKTNAAKQASSESGIGFEGLIIVGIVVVVALFAAWLIRLNSNISKMDDSVRSMKHRE